MKNLKCKVLALCMGASVFMCEKAFSQVPNYVPTNGLVGWWPFNGNANDESGNGNNGTVNGATLTTDRFGNANKAFSFDGIDDYIQLNSLSLIGNQNRSISFFSKLNNANLSSDISAISYGGNSPNCSQAGGDIECGFFNLNNNASVRVDGTCTAAYSNNTIQDSQWHFVVFTFDNTQGIDFNFFKIYIDGLSVSIGAYNGSTILNTVSLSNLVFGKSNKTSRFFDGNLDDIGIWNRALTQQEITNLFNGCSASTITSQPTNQTVNPTTSAQFVVNATSGSSFQWQTDLGFGFQNLSNAGQYSGAINDTLVVSNATVSNNNQQFRCIINSASCADTSDIAVLTVSTVGMNELSVQGNVSLYPNPTQSSFEIQTNLVYSKVEIRDMQGRIVKTEKAAKTINLSSLQKGTYSVNLLDEQEKTLAVRKIVLQ
jgi:hypothetical protein